MRPNIEGIAARLDDALEVNNQLDSQVRALLAYVQELEAALLSIEELSGMQGKGRDRSDSDLLSEVLGIVGVLNIPEPTPQA